MFTAIARVNRWWANTVKWQKTWCNLRLLTPWQPPWWQPKTPMKTIQNQVSWNVLIWWHTYFFISLCRVPPPLRQFCRYSALMQEVRSERFYRMSKRRRVLSLVESLSSNYLLNSQGILLRKLLLKCLYFFALFQSKFWIRYENYFQILPRKR